MELKNFFAQDPAGNILPGATCYLYQPGTANLVTGLQNKNGAPLANPFTAGENGLIQFASPNGRYDLRVTSGAQAYTIRIQCNDVSGNAQVDDLAAPTGAGMIGYGDTTVAEALAALEDGGGGGGGPEPYPASASEALTAGDFVNVYSSGGVITVRKADGGPNKFPAHGFVLASAGTGATAQVSPLTSVNDALSGLIPGTEYYLSTSAAGGVQTTPPNATNVLRQSLGVAISATAIVTTNAMAVELV